MLPLLLASTALLHTPRSSSSSSSSSRLCRPSLSVAPRRAASVRLSEGADPPAEATTTEAQAWPEPAQTPADIQAAQAKAKEEAEAAALANPKPLTTESGDFSGVALITVLVFIAGGFLFLQGITGAGALKFAAGDESPEGQACLKQAKTRDEAGQCLPKVQLCEAYENQGRNVRGCQEN